MQHAVARRSAAQTVVARKRCAVGEMMQAL